MVVVRRFEHVRGGQPSEGIPAWYDTLDPSHAYVGKLDNASFVDDGFSLDGNIFVSTHDAKFIRTDSPDLVLDHALPVIEMPNKLVMKDATGATMLVEHGYDARRHHRIEFLGASGLFNNVADFRWNATFNANFENAAITMVDGDNVQAFLSLDHVWTIGRLARRSKSCCGFRRGNHAA